MTRTAAMNANDPVQMLIDAGAIPSNPFDEHSRYRNAEIALLPAPPAGPVAPAQRPPLAYLRRRFIAQPNEIALAAYVLVQDAERPDLLAARTLGEPLAWWRLADANGVLDPAALTATAGARVAVPVLTG